MFPQPQGSIYSINSPLDLGNVPIGGTGLSVALCMPEQLMYIKSFQNGSPVIMAYRILPFQRQEQKENTEQEKSSATLIERLEKLEEKLNKISTSGGKFNELL
jgi:hypothetical protein